MKRLSSSYCYSLVRIIWFINYWNVVSKDVLAARTQCLVEGMVWILINWLFQGRCVFVFRVLSFVGEPMAPYAESACAQSVSSLFFTQRLLHNIIFRRKFFISVFYSTIIVIPYIPIMNTWSSNNLCLCNTNEYDWLWWLFSQHFVMHFLNKMFICNTAVVDTQLSNIIKQ